MIIDQTELLLAPLEDHENEAENAQNRIFHRQNLTFFSQETSLLKNTTSKFDP
jgi:hypothetical protein